MSCRFLLHGARLLVMMAAVTTCSREPLSTIKLLPGGGIQFPALVNARRFNEGNMPGYHAIVFQGGSAADSALFVAHVTDTQVLDALEFLGATPGNGLDLETWNERGNPDSPAPDRVVTGPPVEILVRLPGHEDPIPLESVLIDSAGCGLDMRLGGHRSNIPRWKSGCIACLYSCPGSKAGNARYTVRDFVRGTTRFRTRPGALPPDGTWVEILLRPAGFAHGD